MTIFDVYRPQPRPSQKDSPWFFAGHRSSFPDIDASALGGLSDTISCLPEISFENNLEPVSLPACKILQTDLIPVSILTPSESEEAGRLDNQVLVFQYRGKFHAVDHQCPHNSFPLSRGRVGDIEDFGVVLSAEITCPKHGWAFDLFTGQSDRGSYQLAIWDVELRDGNDESDDQEVWVTRKVRQRQG